MSESKPLNVDFPIRRKIVTMGDTQDMILNAGDKIKCRICGKEFVANSKTVFRVDDMEYVNCPNIVRTEFDERGNERKIVCGYKRPILYAMHRDMTNYTEVNANE